MSNYTEDEAAAIAGAVGGYLGHNKFKIKSIKEISEEIVEKSEVKIANNSFFAFLGFLKPKK